MFATEIWHVYSTRMNAGLTSSPVAQKGTTILVDEPTLNYDAALTKKCINKGSTLRICILLRFLRVSYNIEGNEGVQGEVYHADFDTRKSELTSSFDGFALEAL